MIAFLRLEFIKSCYQPDIPLIDKIGKRKTVTAELLRDRYDKSEIGPYDPVPRFLVSGLCPESKLILLII